ncbi:MAG: hypothetical protein AB8B99_17875 [Phormidesmis sp.]
MSSVKNIQNLAYSRERIQNLFGNDQQLSSAHFAVLIESLLNRRDDKFHGAWKSGRAYQPGDVVHYERKLWEMKATQEICSAAAEPPAESDSDWEAFPDNNDWEVMTEEKAMWAKMFHRVGIGVGCKDELHWERPQAQLDVRNVAQPNVLAKDAAFSGVGRWLLFPDQVNAATTLPQATPPVLSEASPPVLSPLSLQTGLAQQTFLHYGPLSQDAIADGREPQTSALFTGLSLEEATWSSNALHGFVFRQSPEPLIESSVLRGSATHGPVMMALRPQGNYAAALGLNVREPQALVDAIAPSLGHLQLLPHHADDPVMTLSRCLTEHPSDRPSESLSELGPEGVVGTEGVVEPEGGEESARSPYVSMAIAPAETRWETNATEGFVFSQSGLAESAPDSLVRIRQYPETTQPQFGIGTDHPMAVMDVQSSSQVVQLLPLAPLTDEGCEPLTRPAISISNGSTHLQSGLSEQTASYTTNAAQGFLFRQSFGAREDALPALATGRVQLALRENGRVGIGTEQPDAALDIVHEDQSGRFLFSLSELAEGETAPTTATHPVIAVENRHATSCETDDETGRVQFTFGLHSHQSAFTTNAAHGFSFSSAHTPNSNPLTLSPHEQLVNILPTGIVTVMPDSDGQLGIGTRAPAASLDIQRSENSIQLLPLPGHSDTAIPAISLVSHDRSHDTEQQPLTYLNTGLVGPLAGWLTNASAGFVFKQGYGGQHEGGIEADQARLQMAIAPDGRVGIGTATPEAALDVVNDYHSGRFVLSLSPTNQATDHPTLAILNEQSHCPGVEDALPTYLSLSPQPDEAVFLTDASDGFVFKMGHPAGSERNYLNTGKHGRTLWSLSPNGEAALSPNGNGQLSIGKPHTDYALEVDGLTQALGFYQVADAAQRAQQASLCETFPNALEVVEALRPITFEWTDSDRLSTNGRAASGLQLGLDLETLCEVCPQVVITDADGHQAIAYQNLVPVLIQALNEHVTQTRKTSEREQQYDESERLQLQDQITHLVDRVRIMLFFLMFFGTLTLALTISLTISSLVGGA